jgi:hypothetical protein
LNIFFFRESQIATKTENKFFRFGIGRTDVTLPDAHLLRGWAPPVHAVVAVHLVTAVAAGHPAAVLFLKVCSLLKKKFFYTFGIRVLQNLQVISYFRFFYFYGSSKFRILKIFRIFKIFGFFKNFGFFRICGSLKS